MPELPDIPVDLSGPEFGKHLSLTVRELIYTGVLLVAISTGYTVLRGRIEALERTDDRFGQMLRQYQEQSDRIDERLHHHEEAPGHVGSLERADSLDRRISHLESLTDRFCVPASPPWAK